MGSILWIAAAAAEIFMAVRSLIRQDRDGTGRSIIRITEFILLAVFLLTGVLAWGFRYYMITLVFFVQALSAILYLVRKNRKESSFHTGRTIGGCIGRTFGYWMALLPAIIFPQFEAIQPDGELPVAYDKYTWTDESRVETFAETEEGEEAPYRTLTVEFWYPDGDTEAAWPLVVFSHGANGFSGGNLSTFQQLASHGYVVASIGHTYHSLYTLDTDNRLTTIDMGYNNDVMNLASMEDGEEKYIMNQEWLSLRVEDEAFVLDTVLELAAESHEAPFQNIDTDKIGLFGHSLGGAAAAVLGRTRDDIGAVIDIDGSMLGEITDFRDGQEILNQEAYPVPLLNIYAQDHYELAQKELEENPGMEYYNFHATDGAIQAYEVVLSGAGHLNFTDLPLFSPLLAEALGVGDVEARYGIETTNEIVLEFFDSVLKKGTEPDLRQEY